MYEPSRVLLSFHIAGFQYAEGALVLGDLKAGDKLTLCAERDNPHDPEAVAIYYGNTKLGDCGQKVGPLRSGTKSAWHTVGEWWRGPGRFAAPGSPSWR